MRPAGDKMRWTAVLPDELADRAWRAVRDIADCLSSERFLNTEDPSVLKGSAGFALFFGYLAHVDANREYARLATHYLDAATTTVSSSMTRPSLYYGFTGVAWVAEHLRTTLGMDHTVEVGEDVDNALVTYLQRWKGPKDVDLLRGLVGYGCYALERIPRPEADRILAVVAQCLVREAQQGPTGVAWFT